MKFSYSFKRARDWSHAKRPLDFEQCFEIIEKGAGCDFDPHLVELFMKDRDIVAEMCVINREL